MNSLELEKKILKRRLKFYKIYTQAKRNGFENPGGFAFLQVLAEIIKEQGSDNFTSWKDIEISLKKWLDINDNEYYAAFNFVKEYLNKFRFATNRLIKNE